MEDITFDFIKSLNLTQEQYDALLSTIEWEKEISWSNGYADCEEQTSEQEDGQPAEEFLADKVGMYNQFDPIDADFTYGDVVRWLKEYKRNKGWD